MHLSTDDEDDEERVAAISCGSLTPAAAAASPLLSAICLFRAENTAREFEYVLNPMGFKLPIKKTGDRFIYITYHQLAQGA